MFNTMALMDKLKVTTDKSKIRKIDKILIGWQAYRGDQRHWKNSLT